MKLGIPLGLIAGLCATACSHLGGQGSAGSSAYQSGSGGDEGAAPNALGRVDPFQRAGMADANIAASRQEASMDVSGAGTSELSRRSAAATVSGTAREPLLSHARELVIDRTPDDMLLDRIRLALSSPSPGLSSSTKALSIETLSNLHLDVKNGSVVLRGRVASQQDKDAIDAIVRSVDGVRTVQDLLDVAPAPQLSR